MEILHLLAGLGMPWYPPPEEQEEVAGRGRSLSPRDPTPEKQKDDGQRDGWMDDAYVLKLILNSTNVTLSWREDGTVCIVT